MIVLVITWVSLLTACLRNNFKKHFFKFCKANTIVCLILKHFLKDNLDAMITDIPNLFVQSFIVNRI